MADVGTSELIALLIGAVLTGRGRLISDWRSQQRARIAYLTSIQTEINELCELIQSQVLEGTLRSIIVKCESGTLPDQVPTYDFGYNYFSCFDTLGSEIKNLRKDECRAVVRFYILVKAAFDTLKVDGPVSRAIDTRVLAQNCRFLLSILSQLFVLNKQIQTFVSPRILWGRQ